MTLLRRSTLIALVLAALLATPVAARGAWTFVSARFGYSVRIPAGFIAGPEPANGDGRAFDAVRGDARILVWGAYNVLEETPRQLAARGRNDCDGEEPSYRVTRADMVVYSCLTDDRVLYRKILIRGDTLVTMQMTYAPAERRRWDPVLRTVSASLKPGR